MDDNQLVIENAIQCLQSRGRDSPPHHQAVEEASYDTHVVKSGHPL